MRVKAWNVSGGIDQRASDARLSPSVTPVEAVEAASVANLDESQPHCRTVGDLELSIACAE
jgi:hypothetical protein